MGQHDVETHVLAHGRQIKEIDVKIKQPFKDLYSTQVA